MNKIKHFIIITTILFLQQNVLYGIISINKANKSINFLVNKKEIFKSKSEALPQAGLMLIDSGWLDNAYNNQDILFGDSDFKNVLNLFFTRHHSPTVQATQHNPVAQFTPQQLGNLIGILLSDKISILISTEKKDEKEQIALRSYFKGVKNLTNKLKNYNGKRFFEIIANADAETKNEHFPLSPFALILVINAYAMLKIDSLEDIYHYFLGISEVIPLFLLNPFGIEKQNPDPFEEYVPLEDYINNISDPIDFDQQTKLLTALLHFYIDKNKLPPTIQWVRHEMPIQGQTVQFSDCGEATIRTIVTLLLWNFETKKIDLTLLNYMKRVHMPEPFKSFFSDTTMSSPDTMQSKESAKRWAQLLQEKGELSYLNGNYEVNPSTNSILTTLRFILGLPQTIDNFEKLGEEVSFPDREISFIRQPDDAEGYTVYLMTITLFKEESYNIKLKFSEKHSEIIFQNTEAHTKTKLIIFDTLLKKHYLPRAFQQIITETIHYELHNTIDLNNAADGKPLLHLSVEQNLSSLMPLLLKRQDLNVNLLYYGATPLHMAIEKEYIPIIKMLLEHPNIDVNIPFTAEGKSKSPLVLSLTTEEETKENILEIMSLLLNNPNLEISNQKNSPQQTLDAAIITNNIYAFEFLLAHPRIKLDPEYATATLHKMINRITRSPQNAETIIKMLEIFLKNDLYKESINSVNTKEMTALDCVENLFNQNQKNIQQPLEQKELKEKSFNTIISILKKYGAKTALELKDKF